MRIDLSVIVPIYKGRHYIKKQIEQIRNAAKRTNKMVELIFVNDDPDSDLPEHFDSEIAIAFIQTEKNTGIQAARIRGLNSAKGEYIHFLDQDDEISPDYYDSQLAHIGNASAVYCRCYNGNRQTYNYDRVFETAFDREQVFNVCPVISPGQLLIRRNSIPAFWKEHILKNIGSDDYFLWLCMIAEGCSFAANQELLYKHIRNGENYSSDILRTKLSDDEMVELLLSHPFFKEAELEKLKLLSEKQLRRRYEPQRKDQIVLQILSELLQKYENGFSLEDYFVERGVKSIAIYGAAALGERIKGLLMGTRVQVTCYIDKNAPFITEDIPVYQWDEDKNDFDAIIVSLIEREDTIVKMLKARNGVKVYTIRNIVRELTNG